MQQILGILWLYTVVVRYTHAYVTVNVSFRQGIILMFEYPFCRRNCRNTDGGDSTWLDDL
jgi:hypothetical protein